MTALKAIASLGVGLLLVIGSFRATSQEQSAPPKSAVDQKKDETPKVTPDRPMSFWMAHKLDYSKAILESLTMGDFDSLAADAQQMQKLGKIEGFVRRRHNDYRIQLRSFDVALEELIRQAKRENAEGASLAFNQLTTSCVACHVLIREGIN